MSTVETQVSTTPTKHGITFGIFVLMYGHRQLAFIVGAFGLRVSKLVYRPMSGILVDSSQEEGSIVPEQVR